MKIQTVMGLVETFVPKQSQLTKSEQYVLLTCWVAKEMPGNVADTELMGNDKLVTAKNVLVKMGHITSQGSGVTVTNQGKEALISSGLLDQATDEPTEKGNTLLDQTD